MVRNLAKGQQNYCNINKNASQQLWNILLGFKSEKKSQAYYPIWLQLLWYLYTQLLSHIHQED